MSRKQVLIAGVLLAVLVIVGQDVRYRLRLSEQTARAETLLKQADSLRHKADSAEVRIVERVRVLVRRDTVLQERTREVLAAPVPPGCDSVVAVRDTLLADWQEQAAGWRKQFEEQQRVSADLRAALDASQEGARVALKAAKGGTGILFRLLHPKLQPGVFAGVCLGGQPCVGAGIALTF